MKSRKEINDAVTQWILNKVTSEYSEDISLVMLYGSHINGTAGEKSDVDCYFVPKTNRGYDLAVTYILDGVGYDLFPMPWQRLEDISGLKGSLLPLVGDTQMLYCHSPEDVARFEKLREQLLHNLASKEHTRKAVEDKCLEAARCISRMQNTTHLCTLRKYAGVVVMLLAEAIAFRHGDYYHRGLKKQYQDLCRFPGVPQQIQDGYRNVIEAHGSEAILARTKAYFHDVCHYLDFFPAHPEKAEEADTTPAVCNAAAMAGLYEEICSTFQKVYLCCDSGNHILAFLSAVCLQHELDYAKSLGCPEYDLLRCWDHQNLPSFSENLLHIELDLVQWIENNGGILKRFATFAEFEAANL